MTSSTLSFETWFLSRYPNVPFKSALAVLKLVEEGGTVPFIARYRKEQTGNLDEVGIQNAIDGRDQWEEILKRQAYILEEIEKQGKLTDELKAKIMKTFQLETLEDLYLPYKLKKKTKAVKAKEAGLQPLADLLWGWGHGEKVEAGETPETAAAKFLNEEHGIKDAAAALAGAQDILIERLSENLTTREFVRKALFTSGAIKTEKGEKAVEHSKFEKYFSFEEPIESLKDPANSHRYLAIRRGWMEGELKLSLGGSSSDVSFEEKLLKTFENEACPKKGSVAETALVKAARLALKAHVYPSIESEVHAALKAVADEAAIKVFAENVRKLLMASPYGSKAVLGIDPGIRTGCKVAAVDDSGKFLGNTVLHLQEKRQQEDAKKLLVEVLKNANIRAIAIGNGTAGRETEKFVREVVTEIGSTVPVVMVNESGASVYSASEVAREEFPDLDVTVRGAISIARRLQDPLAELVKIDPKSIGVGQYQHDVSQTALKKSLEGVVDSCVNAVGVNVNTASVYLLSRVSGIGTSLAKAMVEHRSQKGLFQSREDLLAVSRFSKKTFEQAAGFLRIPNSQNPLDNTGVHPERYSVLEGWGKKLGRSVKDFLGSGVELLRKTAKDFKDEVGQFTFEDILKELEKPGRDPREEFVAFQYRDDIHTLEDLKPGMICPGVVTNVTNFGAFVDIGVHQDGLVHISQLAEKFVKDPREVVSPGDHVKAKIIEVNLPKRQIALTLRLAEKPAYSGGASKGDHAEQRNGGGRPGGPGRGAPRPGAPRTGGGHGGGQHKGGGGGMPQHKPSPQPAFNNAFAGLADILKKK